MITSEMAQEKRPDGLATKKGIEKQIPAKTNEELSIDAAITKKEEHIASLSQSPKQGITWWTTTSAMTMSAAVLVFGLITLALASYVVRKGLQWEAVLKIFGMVLIIVMTVFLIVAGYDDKQVAPAMGLLGTIAGYLLGKEVSKEPPTKSKDAGAKEEV